MRKVILVLSCALALAACGDNHGNGDDGDDDDTTIDAAPPPPDANECPSRSVGEVGGPCATNPECGDTVGQCYTQADGFPPEGYCVFDNLAGTVCSEDSHCGEGNVCAEVFPPSGYFVCLPACDCEGGACPVHQMCADTLNSFPLDQSACVPGRAGAGDGDACAGFYECDESSNCFNDNLEFPGGQCARAQCTVGDDSTCHGGHCIAIDDTPVSGNVCVDTCTDDTDCRESEGYVCFDPGGGEDKYCRHPHVGDACAAAADCGSGTWACETGATFPGGYCTQTGCPNPGSSADQCSPGSVCVDPLVGSNFCGDRCDNNDIGSQGRCRTGYLCQDVDPGGGMVGGCVVVGSI